MKLATKAEIEKLAQHFNEKPRTAAATAYVIDMPQSLKVIAAKVKAESEKHRKGSVVNHRKNTTCCNGNTDGADNQRTSQRTGA